MFLNPKRETSRLETKLHAARRISAGRARSAASTTTTIEAYNIILLRVFTRATSVHTMICRAWFKPSSSLQTKTTQQIRGFNARIRSRRARKHVRTLRRFSLLFARWHSGKVHVIRSTICNAHPIPHWKQYISNKLAI